MCHVLKKFMAEIEKNSPYLSYILIENCTIILLFFMIVYNCHSVEISINKYSCGITLTHILSACLKCVL